MAGAYVRTCQSCGCAQVTNPPAPNRELTDAFRNKKCKRCKSPDLDYGSEWDGLPTKEEGAE